MTAFLTILLAGFLLVTVGLIAVRENSGPREGHDEYEEQDTWD